MSVEQMTINTIRTLCADTVQKANSGHPGLPLGAAPAAFAVWAKKMKHNPANPDWRDRDRFVLSAGHGSTLLYSLLHLFGYGLTMDDLASFRQSGSRTPGHPEYGHTRGVEVTTGPLGQGIANAVGMAWAENYLAHKFNRPGYEIIDHYTYALCGDGCLMEGVSAEAASLAGTLGLGKLVLLYDSNQITIEGDTGIAFREDVPGRFAAYGWQVLQVADGNDLEAICKAIDQAKANKDQPTLIKIETQIGFGAPNKQGKASAHGEPLGEEEIRLMKQGFGFDPDKTFAVPGEVTAYMDAYRKEAAAREAEWNALLEAYGKEHSELAAELEAWYAGELAADLLEDEDFWTYEGDLATRISSEKVLNKAAARVPNLFGGSADLAPSTKTIMAGRGDYSKETPTGANLHFGIREHAMTAIANGMALHGGVRPYIAGFFVFADYMKPAMRLSALMNLPVINIMTHDSIGVGEDGPTHQPVEQLAMLRSIPNFTVVRPCDTKETAAAWYLALTRKGPTAIVLTRQNLKLQPESGKPAVRGGYVLRDCAKETPDVILMASGSEVEVVCQAQAMLREKGVEARVVSMPSLEVFEEQPEEYRESVLPGAVRARVAVEAGSEFGWHKYVGFEGAVISMEGFGASAPAGTLFKQFGFTPENVVEKALKVLGR